jgi:hypothetical protein
MSDLKAPTYEHQSLAGRDMPPVGRAFMVRQPSPREATFLKGGGAPKMSDLKAPTYKIQTFTVEINLVTGPLGFP